MSEFTVKYCIEDKGTLLSVMNGNDEDAHKEPLYTSGEAVLWMSAGIFASTRFMMPSLADSNRKNCSSLVRLCSSYSTNKKDISPWLSWKAKFQGVPGGMDKTSGECSLCWIISI